MSNFLRPHGLQHARPPCPSPTPAVYSNSYPLIESVMPSNHLILWCPLLLLPSIFPSIRTFLMSQCGEGNGTPLQYSCLENPMDRGAWWAAVHVVAQSWTRLSDFLFTCHFHALEKAMATHSSVFAWRIPGMAEPGGLPSMVSHRVGHNWSDLAVAAMSQFFASGGQSIGVSASVSVLPMNIQDWVPLGWTGCISLLSKGLSRVFSNTKSTFELIQKHQFFHAQLRL